jgi:hypothetical protein
MLSAVGAQTPTLVELILSGDQDALAGYYDGSAPSVYQYCAQVCPPEHVDEAVLASFADFLGRVRGAGKNADLDEMLRKSTRSAAASRMHLSNTRDPACRSMPELIAARTNRELPHDEAPIKAHLERCRACRRATQRLVEAEDALARPASRQPPDEVRTGWLLIASENAAPSSEGSSTAASAPLPDDTGPEAGEIAAPSSSETVAPASSWLPPGHQATSSAPAARQAEATPAAPRPEPEPPGPTAAQPQPPPSPQPITARRRSGGLIGAARRFASSARRR